jgi:hypothetical protein
MKKRMAIILLLISTLQLAAFECYTTAATLNVTVIAAGDNFSGYYIADGSSINIITGTQIGSSNLYKYTESIAVDTSIRVYAVSDSNAGSSIQIMIYKDSALVASDSATDSDSSTPSLTLDYSYDSNDDD